MSDFIEEKKIYVQNEVEKRYGIKDINVKFDIAAHSMGGLVARYYLRYGTSELPDDGTLPEITWAGARHVDNLVMIGTPNSGSLDSLINLVAGDSEKTMKVATIDSTGHLEITEHGPGDGIVLRSSALGDDRKEDNQSARLISPVHWEQVLFLFADHLDLTKDPVFTDNLLYFLLENP